MRANTIARTHIILQPKLFACLFKLQGNFRAYPFYVNRKLSNAFVLKLQAIKCQQCSISTLNMTVTNKTMNEKK